MNVWQDDPKQYSEIATIHTVVITKVVPLESKGIYDLVVCHVRASGGRGFMYSVRIGFSPIYNSNVFYGEDQKAYDRAVAAGQERLRIECEELEHETATLYPSQNIAG